MCKRTPKQMVEFVRQTMQDISDLFDSEDGNERTLAEDDDDYLALQTILANRVNALEGMIKDTFGLDSYNLRLLIDNAENDL